MKGALLISDRPDLIEAINEHIPKSIWDVTYRETLQIRQKGQLLTIFPKQNAENFPEFKSLENGDKIIHLRWAYPVECRWEKLFCDVVEAIATSAGEFYIVDNGPSVLSPIGLAPSSVYL